MICINDPKHYHNQLNFNLDARSPIPSVSNMRQLNGQHCIVIDKIPPPQKKIAVDSQVQAPSNMSLAVKLAKLDISNGRLEQSGATNIRPEIKPVKKKPQWDPTTVVVREKPIFVIRDAVSRKPKPAAKKTRSHSLRGPTKLKRPAWNRGYEEPPSFEDHVRSIVEPAPAVSRISNHIPQVKDAYTSTAELERELENFQNKSDFKQFASKLKNIVKREKLRVRRGNEKPSNKSGFLSEYRSPKSMVKQTYRSPRSSVKRHPVQCQFAHPSPVTPDRHVRCHMDLSPDFFSSPKLPRHGRRKHSPPTKLSRDEPGTDSKQDETNRVGEIGSAQTKKGPVRFQQDNDMSRSSSPQRHPIHPDTVVSDSAESLKYPMSSRSTRGSDEKRKKPALHLRNLTALTNLYDKLVEMEQDELEIRTRWKAIHYDEIEPTPEAHTRIKDPCATEFTRDHDDSDTHPVEKPIVKFRLDASPIRTFPTSKLSKAAPSDPHKLHLPVHVREAVVDDRKERDRYLKLTHHEPKRGFDPWKIGEELSNQLADEIVSSVIDEVAQACDECVERMFEAEFASPRPQRNSSDLTSSELTRSSIISSVGPRHSTEFATPGLQQQPSSIFDRSPSYGDDTWTDISSSVSSRVA